MAQVVHTRTIHTIVIDIQDDILSNAEMGNEVEVVLKSRYGTTAVKKLTYRDLASLLGDDARHLRLEGGAVRTKR